MSDIKLKIELLDNLDKKTVPYTEPIYTNLNGVWGYIVVSGTKVLFFWTIIEPGEVNYDDITERFTVKYKLESNN